MIGIVIVSHSNIAKEFIEVIEHIVGKQEKVYAVSIFPRMIWNIKETKFWIVLNAQSGKGVIVLTDMFGGTPSNLALSVMEDEKIEVVAGVNLPMLIKMMSLRKKFPIKDVIKKSQEAGRKYINVASAFFEDKKNCKKKD